MKALDTRYRAPRPVLQAQYRALSAQRPPQRAARRYRSVYPPLPFPTPEIRRAAPVSDVGIPGYASSLPEKHILPLATHHLPQRLPRAQYAPLLNQPPQHLQTTSIQRWRIDSVPQWLRHPTLQAEQVLPGRSKKDTVATITQSFGQCRNQADIIGAKWALGITSV